MAEIVTAFLRKHDPERECCRIAEVDGAPAGSAFLVEQSVDMAKLRLLIVEPRARGLEVGRRLVQECIECACGAGYHTITLWTKSVLTAARRIYE
ncbi:MAG: GNAT family N-acetyltransferase [Spirochaetales bacterium]|nr:GNAT family N-acetyltransferase [Spirochaetales bacterium]